MPRTPRHLVTERMKLEQADADRSAKQSTFCENAENKYTEAEQADADRSAKQSTL